MSTLNEVVTILFIDQLHVIIMQKRRDDRYKRNKVCLSPSACIIFCSHMNCLLTLYQTTKF